LWRIKEDEDDDDETENEDGAEDLTASNDAFVDHLLEQVSSLRVKVSSFNDHLSLFLPTHQSFHEYFIDVV
jgi:hypothetical protein